MTSTASPPIAPEWATTPARFGAEWGGSVIVGGDRASDVAGSYHRAGAPPAIDDRQDLVYLSAGREPLSDGATVTATGLTDNSVALVTLRRSWTDGATLAAATDEAFRILRPGGHVIVSDYKADVLLGQSPHLYPLQLVYRQVPEAAERIRAGQRLIAMPLRVMAARFGNVRTEQVDEVLGRFSSAEAYVAFLGSDGADRLVGMTRSQRDEALERLADVLPSVMRSAEIVHREPWALVGAVKPA